MLETLSKLLNQAENAATDAEAEAFFAKAQELATLHAISWQRPAPTPSDHSNANSPPMKSSGSGCHAST